jgi:hypothetical protein
MTVHFEARELKSYAQPVTADELIVGEVYFSVRYVDEDMLVPTVDTLMYIGKNLDAGDSGKLYFQDIDSYLQGVRFATATNDDGALFITESADKPWVFNFERALELLMQCSLRRQTKSTIRLPRVE